VTERKNKFNGLNIWLDRIKPYATDKEKDDIDLLVADEANFDFNS